MRRTSATPSPGRAFVTADRLHSAAIHLLRWVREVDTAHGLPAARLSALSVLVFVGPQTVGSLARHEQVTPATISKLLDRLEADGLCRRTRSRADRRVVTVSASPAGKRLLQGARRRRVERLASGLRSLSDVELGTLRRSAALVEGVVRRGSEDRA